MRIMTTCKNVVIGLAILVIIMVSASSSPLFGEDHFVLVTMRDDSVIKFQYDSFSLHWVNTQIKDEETCEIYDFSPSNLVEIYILNPALNRCDQREDDWLFDVYFRDRTPIQGFIEITSEDVTGKLFETGVEKTIPFQEIRKVSYQ